MGRRAEGGRPRAVSDQPPSAGKRTGKRDGGGGSPSSLRSLLFSRPCFTPWRVWGSVRGRVRSKGRARARVHPHD
jgi:hypothetical protein